jgi:hypothetical protein
VDPEDEERVELHKHQLNKYKDDEIKRIAQKGDNGEELTEEDKFN